MNVAHGTGPPSSRLPALALPDAGAVRAMLEGLFGGAVAVTPAPRPLAAAGAGLAVYSSSATRSPAAFALCDVGFIAASGSALSALPVRLVAQAVRSGRVTEPMLENWAEVVNIFAALFNEISALHVRLTAHAAPAASSESEILTAAGASHARADFEVTIRRYGSGKLTFVGLISA